jgi:hypothetical protein
MGQHPALASGARSEPAGTAPGIRPAIPTGGVVPEGVVRLQWPMLPGSGTCAVRAATAMVTFAATR